MTVRGLSRHLKKEYERSVDFAQLETMLKVYAQEPGRTIRYSSYPRRQSMDILWGHTANVGELKYLPALQRLDEPVEYSASQVDEAAPWFFISHNHRDLAHVLALRSQLMDRGYGVWIFESEISQGGEIPASIKGAIQRCKHFISYVSARSIGSLWVQKEVEAALGGGVQEVHLVVDGDDVRLLDLLADWRPLKSPDPELIEEYCLWAASSIGKARNNVWLERCRYFMDHLDEYLWRTDEVVVAFPSPKNKDLWAGRAIKLKSLSEFVEDEHLTHN